MSCSEPRLVPAAEICARPIVEYLATVLENARAGPGYQCLAISTHPSAVSAGPGQFFHLLCPADGDDTPFLRRPMSVYRVCRDRIEFLFKITGAGTRTLAALRPGASLSVVGPLGRGFEIPAGSRHILIVARGVGLATLAPLADLAGARGVRVTTILSARDTSSILKPERFQGPGCRVIPVLDADGSSEPCRVEALVERLVAEEGVDAVFTCGSDRLLRLLQRVTMRHDFPGQVALEQQMACGFGMCFSCVRWFPEGGGLVDRRVCVDGPVFDLTLVPQWSI